MKLHLVSSGSRLALAVGAVALSCASASAQDAAAPSADTAAPPENVIVVSGVRQSIESSIDDKRQATEIKDSITAEDIGQLANENISEALQRITGVQVIRGNDGEGKNVQIRGLSENNVTINGATASGTGDVDLSNGNDRSVNFQDLSPELFEGVEILKALSADQIEGSLGGTINLQTRAPLRGKRDLIVNLSATDKYAEVGRLWNQDANLYVQKKFLDTPLGDFGVIVNLGYKEIGSYAYVYGGGEFEDAPGIWQRKTGDVDPTPSAGTSQTAAGYNYFALATIPVLNAAGANTNVSIANPYRYAFDDPNGDGLSDAKDVYYIPGAFQTSERIRDDVRKSFNGTLQWKPARNLDIRFDALLTDIDQKLTGANSNLVSNVPRAGYLNSPNTAFENLGTTPNFGDVYVLTAGRLSSFNTRVGAAPSINETFRDSQQYSLEAKWDVTPNFSLYAKGSKSQGKATTGNFGQLSAGIEHQGGTTNAGQFNTQDFYHIVDFNLGTGLIPNVKFYESPFPSLTYATKSVVPESGLVELTPGDLSYNRYRYFQYQRNAADTKNTDDSIRFDATWEPGAGFIKAIKAGFRWAERGFERARYENQSQGGAIFTAWDGVRAPVQAVGIQNVPVNPAQVAPAGAAATSTFLQQCLSKAGNPAVLGRFGGNYPLAYDSTGGCDITAVQDYFNMIGIREVNPVTGAGYYEIRQERFDISEKTTAGYLRADFRSNLGTVNLFGNVGVRYVKTETSSSGYLENPFVGNPRTYSLITVENSYDDWLPSANLNFAFSKDFIARLAYSRTLGRPGLTQISTGLDVQRDTTGAGPFAGSGTAGNPFLSPVHSDNFDVSLEWYYDKGSYLSAAGFAKNIDTTIFLSPTPIEYDLNGEIFNVFQFQNFGGTKLKGVELGMAHAFNYLPGLLSHLGVTGNFTYIDEKSDLRDQEGDPISRKGLSKYNWNASGYYDDGKLSLRLAYNWRSAFTRRETAPLGFARPESLPETEAARGQLDFAARLTVNRNIRFSFNAINLTDTGTQRYLKYPILVNYLALAGRKYTLGVAVSF